MATYLRPGVFVEETLLPLNETNSDSNESVAAFVGSASGGPVGPTLVTSWSQYQTLFGSIRSARSALSYAVYTYFSNGGGQAYVVRAVNNDATAAALTLKDTQATPEDTLTATAKSPGIWASDPASASRIYLTIKPSTNGGRFDVVIEVGTGATLVAREQFSDLTLDPTDSRYAISILNSPTVGSRFLTFTKAGDWVAATGSTQNPAAASQVPLTGGTEGTGTPDLLAAAKTLEQVDANLTLNLPEVSDSALLLDLITWAEGRGNVFVVIDSPKPAATDSASDVAAAMTTLAAGLPASSYAAVYGPWIYVNDPASSVSGALTLVAPGGAVVGQYAYTDTARGVQKAPAGVGTALKGTVAAAVKFSDSQLDTLNDANVNVIRSVPGYGFCVMGARTLDRSTTGRYVNNRRTMMYLSRGLVGLTRFAIFEPNDADLWDLLSAVVTQYLTTQFQIGVLKGSTPQQAFYVVCNDTINTADSANAGVVKIEVGVALASPAEFVVIRIGQFEGGNSVQITES